MNAWHPSSRTSLKNLGCLLTVVFALSLLTSCGGTMAPRPAPIVSHVPAFSSAPLTSAAEGVAYSYQLAAAAPDGSSVSFALTTAPAGAVLNGNTITWTPTHAQSRIANGFAVAATTAAGGSASQSWSVTPTGNVQVSWIETFWTESGPVDEPVPLQAFARFLRVLVPQPDGSYKVLHATSGSNGTATVSGVPGGYYWLEIGPGANYWTSTSSFDFGMDFIGRDFFQPAPNVGNTTLNLSTGGLDPIQPQDWFGFVMDNHVDLLDSPIFGAAGSTTFQETADIGGGIDWSQIKTIFLGQYEAASSSSLNALALGPASTLSNVSLSNGGVNNISATLTASPVHSLDVSVKGSEWATLFHHVAPAPVTPVGSVLAVSAQPWLTDRNAVAWDRPMGPNLPLIGPDIKINGWSSGMSSCVDSSSIFIPSSFPVASQPPILTDQDFGAVQYGDPYPVDWPRVFTFCQKVTAPIPIPGSNLTSDFLLQYGQASQLPTAPVSPLVLPVENPTVDGASLFTPVTLDTSAVTLNWSAPEGAQPYGYYISEFVLLNQNGKLVYWPTATFGAARAPITLPPLAPGMTYVFVIAAEVDGRANIETSPNRSALPTAYANVVSAPITISSAAAGPVVHDDAGAGNNRNDSAGVAADPNSPRPDIYEPFPFRQGRKPQ